MHAKLKSISIHGHFLFVWHGAFSFVGRGLVIFYLTVLMSVPYESGFADALCFSILVLDLVYNPCRVSDF